MDIDIIKELSKKKNRQRLHRMTLPNEKTQNYQIKMVFQIRHFVGFEPLGEVTDINESGTGTSDPYIGV